MTKPMKKMRVNILRRKDMTHDEGEALAREGAWEEDTFQEGADGEDFVHEVDGEEDLEQGGVE